MGSYSIEVLKDKIKELETAIENVKKESDDQRLIDAVTFINDTKITELRMAIWIITNA